MKFTKADVTQMELMKNKCTCGTHSRLDGVHRDDMIMSFVSYLSCLGIFGF